MDVDGQHVELVTPDAQRAPWWPSRYGPDDEQGTLNEITPAKVSAAARLVQAGRVYDLGRTLHADVPSFPGRFWRQTLVSSAHLTNPGRPGSGPGGWGRNQVNWVTELVTGTLQIGTHLDGLNHLQIGDRCYNGIDRLKFKDALEIDQQIGAEGMFVGMCAEVCGLYVAMDTIASRESQPNTGSREPWMDAHANAYRRLASLATKLYRWWQFLHGEEDAWLHDLRDQ